MFYLLDFQVTKAVEKKLGPVPQIIEQNRHIDNVSHLFQTYFEESHVDLRLLLRIIANKYDIPEGLRFISFFDNDYQRLWQAFNIKVMTIILIVICL